MEEHFVFDSVISALSKARDEHNSLIKKVIDEVKGLEEKAKKLEEARQQVKDEKAKLDRERQQFETEKASVADVNARASDVVHLNVGGQVVTTSRRTLCTYEDSMLAAWFSGRHTLKRDSDGHIVIDRDPAFFQYVLDYCRNNGEMPHLPEDQGLRARIREEFDFFCLPWPYETPSLVQLFMGQTREIKLVGHTKPVTAIDMNESVVVTGGRSNDCTVRVWDIQTGACKHVLRGHRTHVRSIAVAYNRVATGAADGLIIVWDLTTGEKISAFEVGGEVRALGLERDVLATIILGEDATSHRLGVWNITTTERLWQLPGVRNPRGRVSIYDGRFVGCCIKHEAHILDLFTGETLQKFGGFGSATPSNLSISKAHVIAWTSKVVSNNARTVVVYNRTTGEEMQRRVIPAGEGMGFVHGRTFFTILLQTLLITDIFDGSYVKLRGHDKPINAMTATDGAVATASQDGCAVVWLPAAGAGQAERPNKRIKLDDTAEGHTDGTASDA